jgi:hypothetical protein
MAQEAIPQMITDADVDAFLAANPSARAIYGDDRDAARQFITNFALSSVPEQVTRNYVSDPTYSSSDDEPQGFPFTPAMVQTGDGTSTAKQASTLTTGTGKRLMNRFGDPSKFTTFFIPLLSALNIDPKILWSENKTKLADAVKRIKSVHGPEAAAAIKAAEEDFSVRYMPMAFYSKDKPMNEEDEASVELIPSMALFNIDTETLSNGLTDFVKQYNENLKRKDDKITAEDIMTKAKPVGFAASDALVPAGTRLYQASIGDNTVQFLGVLNDHIDVFNKLNMSLGDKNTRGNLKTPEFDAGRYKLSAELNVGNDYKYGFSKYILKDPYGKTTEFAPNQINELNEIIYPQ